MVDMGKPRVCILRVGGTNCDAETRTAFTELGASADVVHLNEVIARRNLLDYDALVIPGGFSHGDYVRAGAILSRRVVSNLSDELHRFVEGRRPVLGICNGFQVLVEMGLLPGLDGISRVPEASLAVNDSAKFECRWVHLKHESNGKCVFTRKLGKGQVVSMPVAHGEGKFVLPKDREKPYLKKLRENGQLVFRYCDESGKPAGGKYPANPNGALRDIAGICNPDGTVFGLMPHPERAYDGFQLPDWTARGKAKKCGDGRLIFQSVMDYLNER